MSRELGVGGAGSAGVLVAKLCTLSVSEFRIDLTISSLFCLLRSRAWLAASRLRFCWSCKRHTCSSACTQLRRCLPHKNARDIYSVNSKHEPMKVHLVLK